MMPRITNLRAYDIRFPTSFDSDGSDALHTDPDYSACYVKLLVEDTEVNQQYQSEERTRKLSHAVGTD